MLYWWISWQWMNTSPKIKTKLQRLIFLYTCKSWIFAAEFRQWKWDTLGIPIKNTSQMKRLGIYDLFTTIKKMVWPHNKKTDLQNQSYKKQSRARKEGEDKKKWRAGNISEKFSLNQIPISWQPYGKWSPPVR